MFMNIFKRFLSLFHSASKPPVPAPVLPQYSIPEHPELTALNVKYEADRARVLIDLTVPGETLYTWRYISPALVTVTLPPGNWAWEVSDDGVNFRRPFATSVFSSVAPDLFRVDLTLDGKTAAPSWGRWTKL